MANRSIKKHMKAIFERIESHFNHTDSIVAKRSIHLKPEEFKDLEKCTIEPPIVLSKDIKLGYASIPGNNDFIYIVGAIDASPTSDMSDYADCHGLQLAVIEELKLEVVENAKVGSLLNMLYEENEDGTVDLIDYSQISEFFQPVTIYEYKGSKVDTSLLAIRFLLANPQYLYLEFQPKVLTSFGMIESAGFNSLDYETLLRSLCASQWRYCFLDLYRCIESLFLFNRCNELYKSLGSLATLNQTNVCDSLYDKFSLFFVEKDVLEALFMEITTPTETMLKALPQTKGVDSYYNLRNTIAHGNKRPNKLPVVISSVQEWNDVCDFSLHAIKDLFDKYDSDFYKFKYR